jgi:hypothetical protein
MFGLAVENASLHEYVNGVKRVPHLKILLSEEKYFRMEEIINIFGDLLIWRYN